tara:strand:+ start:688 stop:1359 length:672 start_codon:yes stop_codon:yes gene_type:complete
MAIGFGFKTVSNQNPNANKQQLSVTCSSGTDTGLFVSVTMAKTVTFNNAFYNNVQMQKLTIRTNDHLSLRQVFYWLPNPTTGSAKTLEVRFTGGQYAPTSIIAQSLTGVTQNNLSNEAYNFHANTPHSRTISINANEVIYLTGMGQQGQAYPYNIGGNSEALDLNQHNVNSKIIGGAFSVNNLGSGSQTCIAVANSGTITNHRIAIGGSGGGSSSSINHIWTC